MESRQQQNFLETGFPSVTALNGFGIQYMQGNVYDAKLDLLFFFFDNHIIDTKYLPIFSNDALFNVQQASELAHKVFGHV